MNDDQLLSFKTTIIDKFKVSTDCKIYDSCIAQIAQQDKCSTVHCQLYLYSDQCEDL